MRTSQRLWIRAIIGGACVAALLLLAYRLGPREPPPMGSVVAYHVVDDNTAFLLWTADEGDWGSSGWLSRIDGKGHTVWLRRLPAAPNLGDALRVGADVVGVRYSKSDVSGQENLSMVAFGFDGQQLWDRVLGPYYPKQTGHGPTLPVSVGGAATDEHFVEWVDSEKDVTLIGLMQRTGVPSFSEVIGLVPTHPYAFPNRLIWFGGDVTQVAQRAADPGRAGLVLRSVDVKTGAMQQLLVAGSGCVLDGDYVTIALREGGRSLVALPGGDLASPRVIAERFDPFGDGRAFSLRTCGRHNGKFVLLVESQMGRASEATVLVTDNGGALQRSMRLELALIHGPGGKLPDRFELHSPLSGDLSKYVPVIVPEPPPSVHDELVVIDLEKMTIASRRRIWPDAWVALFKIGERSYMSELRGSLALSAIDGSTGRLAAAVRATPTAQHSTFEKPVLPPHVAMRTVWLVPYVRTRLDEPPVAVLDSTTLRAVRTSGLIALSVDSPAASK